jgi:membrane-associated protease RseP (regulator of RpoE activity)
MSDFEFTQKYTISTPKEKKVYTVYHSDWERLKKMVGKIVPHTRIFQVLYSISFSIFVAAFFALLAFTTAKEVPSWVQLTTWVLLISSFIVGLALFFLDNQQKEVIQFSIDMILGEMQSIEDSCNSLINASTSKKIIMGIACHNLSPEMQQKIGSNKGVMIIRVIGGSPAFFAGLLIGDIIKRADNKEIVDTQSLFEFLDTNAGKEVEFVITRDNKEITKLVKLNPA